MSNFVRFFNADCMGRKISFYIDGKLALSDVEFGCFGEYLKMDGESKTFGITCSGCNEEKCSTLTLTFEHSSVYTIVAVCVGSDVCLYGIREVFNQKNKSGANLRICNLSPDISGDDLYANRYKIIGDMEYLEVSKYIKLVPDTYDFTVKDGKQIKYNIGNQTLPKGKYNTFYFIGKLNSEPGLKCIVSVDAMSYETDAL